MTLLELEQHVIAAAMKRHHFHRVSVAEHLRIGVNELSRKLADPRFHDLPQDPMLDAMMLVDVLREYLPMLPADQRLLVSESVMDGYCTDCGSDACPKDKCGWPY